MTCVPSQRHPNLVRYFAHRLAIALALPFEAVLLKVQNRPPQKEMANSAYQGRNEIYTIQVMTERVQEAPGLLSIRMQKYKDRDCPVESGPANRREPIRHARATLSSTHSPPAPTAQGTAPRPSPESPRVGPVRDVPALVGWHDRTSTGAPLWRLRGHPDRHSHNPAPRTVYARLCDKGKTRKVAIVAAMRKLLTVLNAVMRRQVLWQREHVTMPINP